MPTLDDLTSDSDFQQLAPRDQRVLVGRLLDGDSDYQQLSSHDQLVLKNRAQGRFPDATPSQASSSLPANTTQTQLQSKWNTLMKKSPASNAPITMQTLPMLGKPSAPPTLGKSLTNAQQASIAAKEQDIQSGNAFYSGSQLNALPHDFLGNLKRNLSGMTTPENAAMLTGITAASALGGPIGAGLARAAGLYFMGQGVAGGIKEGIQQTKQGGLAHGIGAGLGVAAPFILPEAFGRAGEMVRAKGLPAPPEAQPTAPVQPGRPIVPSEPGTARPPFVGNPTPETATPPPAVETPPVSKTATAQPPKPIMAKNAQHATPFTTEVYHGSSDLRFTNNGDWTKTGDNYGGAIFFSDNPRIAKTYADPKRAFDYQNSEPGVIKRYVTLNNPKVIDAGGESWKNTRSEVAQAKAEGYDGLVIKNVRDAYNALDNPKVNHVGTNVVAFDPSAISKTTPEATAAAPVNMATPAVEPPVTPETPAVPNPAPTAETLSSELAKPIFAATHTIGDTPVIKADTGGKNAYADEQGNVVKATTKIPAVLIPAEITPVPGESTNVKISPLTASIEDVKAGKVAGIKFNPNKPDTTVASRDVGGGVTEVTGKYFDLKPEDRSALLAHELGHDVTAKILSKGLDNVPELEPFRKNSNKPLSIHNANYNNPSGFSELPEEVLSDVYSHLVFGNGKIPFESEKNVNLFNLVAKTAKELNLPLDKEGIDNYYRDFSEENQKNVQPTGLRPVSEVKPGSETNIVVPEQAATAAGKPVERPVETASRPAETKTGTPEEPPRTTGIAQRVHDVRNSGAIQPGEGASPEQILGYGRKWIKDGGDPEAHMQMMESRGKSAEGGDIGIVRAQHEILSQETDRASDASRAKPLDKNLKDAYNTAKQAETDWAKRIKPFQTEWQKAGAGMQGETATDTGSFTSIQRAFEKTANRPMTPNEQTQAAAHADKVKGLETQVTDLQSKLDTAMKQMAETKTAVRTGTNKSNKISLPSDPVELRKALAEMRAKGGLFNSGKGIIEVKPGAKTGAVNFGSKPQFIPEVARAIWNHAKENYIDKGVDFPTTVNGVASDLGLTHDEVMGAFAQNKYIKDITDEMYKTMSARRDAVNAAKRFIETSNQSGAAKAWNTVTNLPRGIAVFGHGSVGMVTHAGANIFRPTSWSAYWPNALNQFKYWTDGAFHERAMQKIENDPNYTMWDRNGLRINPDKAYDDYQKYGKFIGNIGRAGNRGMDALKSFRMEYANKIWEGLPENLKQQKDMPKLIADWVNHATGVGSIGHGQIASAVHEGTFAATLEASRWARLIGDPVKTAKTFANWKTATPAEQAIAKFRVQRAAELTAVMAGALAANNGLLVATNQKDRINMLHPTQSDWLKFKWDGKTFDPTGNLAAPVKFLAQLLAEANPNRTPAAWEHGEKRSELMTQTMGQYIRGKLAPQYGIAADVATGADAIGRPLPWAKEPGKPSAPKYTPTEYTLKHAPLPFAGAAEAVYEAMREKGANDAESRGWVDKLTKYGGTFAKTLGTEMTGIRVGKPSKPFIPASKGSGVSYKSPKF